MKARIQPSPTASALIVTMVTVVILAFTLSSFLILVTAEQRSVARSIAWNSTLPVAESGLEEALAQLHHTGTNPPDNNWKLGSDGAYHKSRAVGDEGSYYDVALRLAANPVIYSTGYVRAPLATNYLRRAVRVVTRRATDAKGGLVTRGAVSLNNGTFLDSFDSSDSNFSTNGVYTPARRKANGFISSNGGSAGIISLSGGGVFGTVASGPGGSVELLGGAKVGEPGWMADGFTWGIQPGHLSRDANIDLPTVLAPYSSGSPPLAGVYSGSNYTFLLGTAKYYSAAKLVIPADSVMGVTGDAALYVNNDFVCSDSGCVYLFPGARLKLFVSGDFTVSGAGIINGSQQATNLTIYGVNAGPKTWSYSASAPFIGTICAPNSDLNFTGGGGASGSFIVNSASFSTGAGVHYDEALARIRKGFVVVSWTEF